MKYIVDEIANQLLRVDNDRSEHVWITANRDWMATKDQEAQDGLFWGEGDFREVTEPEAKELFPDAFGGEPLPQTPTDHTVRFEQEPLTAEETGMLISYFGGGKSLKEYLEEQNVPPIKQGSAQQMWLNAWNEKRKNPNVGFDTPSEWA